MNAILKLILFFSLSSCSNRDTLSDIEVPPSVKEEGISIMTYNIYQSDHEKDPSKPRSWAFRKEMVMNLLEDSEIDILGAQEDNPNQGEDIISSLGFSRVGVSKITGTEEGTGVFNAIYYDNGRFNLIDSGYFWFSETPDVPSKSWDAQTSSSCNWALFFDINTSKEFYIFNTHLDYSGDITRSKSADILKEKMTNIARDKPAILMGDMNSGPNSQPISKISSFLKNTHLISKSPPLGPEGSYNAFDIKYDISKWRLDYIFVTDKIEILTHETISDSENGHYPSDHFPVLCKIIIL